MIPAFASDIEAALSVLLKGGTILYPTDTVWAIGCDATNEGAVEKIYQIKNTLEKIGLVILLAEERDVIQYVTQPDLSVFDYLAEAAKPTTVIYEGATALAENLLNQEGGVAIRICADPFCRHLLKRFRKPIVATTANQVTTAIPGAFDAIHSEIKNGVDYIVQHRQNDIGLSVPSTVIQWNGAGSLPTVIRT